MSFDPDDTPPAGRKQPTAEHVIRDLRRGDGVRAEWAPVAVGELLRVRLVRVTRHGWVRIVGEARQRKQTGSHHRHVERPYGAARDRELQIAALLPATLYAIAAHVSIGPAGVRRALIRIGAEPVGEEPTPSGGRPRVIWGLPLPSVSDRVGRTQGEST